MPRAPELQEAIEDAGGKMQEVATKLFSAHEHERLTDEDFADLLEGAGGVRHERADQLMLELIYGAR